jgi:FtsP/CotA-like multicopper oxidase with cupredoxin domain
MIINRRAFLGAPLAACPLLLPGGSMAEGQGPAPAGKVADAAGFTRLEAGPATTALLADAAPTATLAFNGTVPGPVIRVRQGAEVRVRLVNRLDQPTSLHWHGVRIDNAMDGVAGLTQPPVPPGGVFDYRFVARDSGTFWYHPLARPAAAEQVARGLYGLLIVDEPEPPKVDGDLSLVIDEWRLDGDGRIADDFLSPVDPGRQDKPGSLVTLNSKPIPQVASHPPGARLRLRIVNVANGRLMAVTVDGTRPLIVAIDGQPCEPFEPVHRTVPIGPGACFDLMLDLPSEAGARVKLVLRGDKDRDLLTLATAGAPRPPQPGFIGLKLNPKLPAAIRLEAARRVDLVLDGGSGLPAWTVNGSPGPGAKPVLAVKRGTPVVLGFVNKSAVPQVMQVHGHVLRLLHDLDDGWEPYWRDSVFIEPGRTHHAAFVADNPGKWLVGSAVLAHAMTGLATWFEVT